MAYVERDSKNNIIALHRHRQSNLSEELPNNHPDVIDFLFSDLKPENAEQTLFSNDLYELRLSDLGMIRILEDLISILLDKSVIDISDLPAEALQRLQYRRAIRQRLDSINSVLQEKL
jgi:hypothetical protein